MTINTLSVCMYLLGILSGILIGSNISGLCMSHTSKKMCELIEQ